MKNCLNKKINKPFLKAKPVTDIMNKGINELIKPISTTPRALNNIPTGFVEPQYQKKFLIGS